MAGPDLMSDNITVEVVFAVPEKQHLVTIKLPEGSIVADAIAESAIAGRFKGADLDSLQVGIWGRPVGRDATLADGDRVEIYRELEIDPREARRQLALAGRTMSQPDDQ